MTITKTYAPDKYAGDGVQVDFPVTFDFLDSGNIKATVTDAADVDTALVAGVDYSVTGATLTTTVPVASGSRLTIWLDADYLQDTDWKNTGNYNLETLERAMDKAAVERQILKEAFSRTVTLPLTSEDTPENYLGQVRAARDAAVTARDGAEASKNAAAQSAAEAESSAIRAETAAEQAELPIASPGDEGKVLTISPSLEKEWAEVPEELPPYSVADEGKVLKVSSLGETEWGIEEKELPPYTEAEAGKTLSVNAGGDAVEWTDPLKGSVNIAPQTIVRAQVGSRPDGWTAADCDAPVASLSHSGNVVTVEAGLQVAYADGGRVQLSEELVSPQVVDLSAAADGTHHVYADIAEDGTFSGFGHTDVAPQINTRELLSYPVPVAASSTAADRDIEFSVDGNPATYWGAGAGSGAVVIGVWIEFTLPDSKSGVKSIISTSSASYVGSAPSTADVEQLVGGVWTKVGELVYIDNTLRGSFDSVEGNNTVRLKATAATVNSSYGWTISDIQVSDLTAGDIYNISGVTMYDKDDNPIRRVYLGWVEKSGGAITDVHCYSLGSSVTVPVNDGGLVAKNTTVVEDLPYVFSRNSNAKAQVFAEGFWGNTGWVYSSNPEGGYGVKASSLKDSLYIRSGSYALSTSMSNGGGDFTTVITTPSRIRVTVDRGY
jgi:hypothetical protein